MPSRSFYFPSDFKHIEAILADAQSDQFLKSPPLFAGGNVAPLLDENSIAYAVGVDRSIIKEIIRKTHRHYRRFFISQKNGKIREICAPRTYLKVIQWWILDNILVRGDWPVCVQGFVRGRSAQTNAMMHKGARHIINIDIKDFFPSISSERVERVFLDLGYPAAAANILTKLCTYGGRLPQGAPTSPALANHVVMGMDRRLGDVALRHGCKYSRYADDLTFSSFNFIHAGIVKEVSSVINLYGFRINEKKTDICGMGGRLEVTGFVINKKVQLPRSWRKRVRAIFHQASLCPEKFVERRNELVGYVSMMRCFEECSEQIISAYNKIIGSIPCPKANSEQPSDG